MNRSLTCFIPALLLFLLVACDANRQASTAKVFTGATIIVGDSSAIIENGTVVIENGLIASIGSTEEIKIPEGAEVVGATGKTIMPGLINAHGHIGGTEGLDGNRYSRENAIRDLRLNARYGVTTVNSLGGDGEPSVELRNIQDTVALDRSRIFVAGEVVTGSTPEEARAIVDKNAAMGVDVIKIRVDDNLGSTQKMLPEIYEAVIDQASKHNLPVAAHIYYLEDAKAMLNLGVRFIAHSVRDTLVDEEFIQLMKANNAYYCPTLMREVSVFVYESTPDFFNDPFFLKEADTAVIRQLNDPARQQSVATSKSAQAYKEALKTAKQNLKILSDNGVRIAMGTDTGPPARFEGYFEHLELEHMIDAGLTPIDVIESATGTAAASIGKPALGTLKAGNKADFILLEKNPLDDIRNTRTIESVWIGGNQVPGVKK